MRKRTRIVVLLLIIICSLFVNLNSSVNYKSEMVNLISEIRSYAKSKNSKFNIIINGGYGLYAPKQKLRDKTLKVVDGVLVEDVYYGWDAKMNKKTPSTESKKILSSLKYAKSHGVPIFTIEYCNGKYRDDAKQKNKTLNPTCYYSSSINLNRILKISGNEQDVTKLEQVNNYLVVLDPDRYKSKKSYLSALKNTNYDMIIIDAFYNGKILTKKEVNSLKRKKNGRRRLVCTYISVGEAEDYRYYFKKSWKKKHPSWLKSENPSWHGNYKVKYWDKRWKTILKNYIKKSISAGFDGAYFDVIDAYEYFEG